MFLGIAEIAFDPPFVKQAPWGTFFGPYFSSLIDAMTLETRTQGLHSSGNRYMHQLYNSVACGRVGTPASAAMFFVIVEVS